MKILKSKWWGSTQTTLTTWVSFTFLIYLAFESKFQSETVNRSKGVEEKDEEFPRRKLRKRWKSSYHSIQ